MFTASRFGRRRVWRRKTSGSFRRKRERIIYDNDGCNYLYLSLIFFLICIGRISRKSGLIRSRTHRLLPFCRHNRYDPTTSFSVCAAILFVFRRKITISKHANPHNGFWLHEQKKHLKNRLRSDRVNDYILSTERACWRRNGRGKNAPETLGLNDDDDSANRRGKQRFLTGNSLVLEQKSFGKSCTATG